ncbi:ATP-binding protein [Paenibacillus sp. GP183]|uniref:ATP-binding protein n=1 Tax=Paenibacillus sp. GP183 TaxID=1882751 RepID=UPI000898B1AB|nr:ATP-binding protein [Paenibacillus sp. GP183]SEB43253.1 diguanylate cyclase (GGDEF) domain-containing protein [Paenibacillus sp. GP183]
MFLNFILYVYACLFTVSSIFMQETSMPFFLIFCLLLFILSIRLSILPAWAPWVRLLLICCFHVVSQSNWCQPLYLLAMVKDTYAEENRRKTMVLSLTYALFYMFTSFFVLKKEISTMIMFFQIMNLVNFLATAFLTRSIFSAVKQTELLKKEKKFLSTQDTLTGLYNYSEFHRKLEDFAAKDLPFLLVLIDCTDLKSLNNSRGFQAGNMILKQVAELLKILFKDTLIISRYGGDEFAMVLPVTDEDKSLTTARHLLENELPKLTGIQITYGIAAFPMNGQTKDELILVAEHHLFMMKREMWLKREEHMLRSEKLRVVGELASGMAHEIRNPLTTVKGFLQISKANGYNIENWYALIMDEINRMSDLTAEFLQFSKPHATQFRVQSLHDCILRVISLTESEAAKLGHQLHYEHPKEPIHVIMDQDKMVQLLLNLVKNAYEAIQEKGIVNLCLFRKNHHAILIVQDNGQGIPSDQLEKIFHPFYTTKESGTGLGLAICHKIVQDHQGTMGVESVLHQGTTFTITLPVVYDDNDAEFIQAAYI